MLFTDSVTEVVILELGVEEFKGGLSVVKKETLTALGVEGTIGVDSLFELVLVFGVV